MADYRAGIGLSDNSLLRDKGNVSGMYVCMGGIGVLPVGSAR